MEAIVEAGHEKVSQVIPPTENHSPVQMSMLATWFLLRCKEVSHVNIGDASISMDINAGRHGVVVLKLTKSKIDVQAKGTTRRLPCPCQSGEADLAECPANALHEVIGQAMSHLQRLCQQGCDIDADECPLFFGEVDPESVGGDYRPERLPYEKVVQ